MEEKKSEKSVKVKMKSKNEEITVSNVNVPDKGTDNHEEVTEKSVKVVTNGEKAAAESIFALANGTDIQMPGSPDFPENEPSVAVNPMDPSTIIVVSHDFIVDGFALFRSFDGGNTFSYSILPSPPGFVAGLSDPIVDFGLNNLSLISGIAVNDAVDPEESSIIVFRSTDGGHTYSDAIIVSTEVGMGIFDDKEYLAIDKSPESPFEGNAYVSYTRFTENPLFGFNRQILFQRSLDGGLNWQPPVLITPVIPIYPFVQGSAVHVGPKGEVYVAWIEGGELTASFKIRRSDDGGVTFGPTVTVSPFLRPPSTFESEVPNWEFRVPDFAFLAVDRSGCFGSAEFARVYSVWHAEVDGDAHILLSFSDDGGVTWIAPIRVDNSPENTQNFFPFVTVSPFSGTVTVIYYTNRVSPTLIDVFLAVSVDGGLTFPVNTRITDVSFDPNADPSFGVPSQFIGDYIFSAIIPPSLSEPEKLVSVWTDTRTGDQQIWADISVLPLAQIPVINCPDDIRVFNEPGRRGAVVNFPDPVVENICSDVTTECTPASGSFFPIGTTTVTCTATTAAGFTSTCSFEVTVVIDPCRFLSIMRRCGDDAF